MKKPDAVTVLSPENWEERVWPLPVSELLYVGHSTTRKLMSRGVLTIGDLAHYPYEINTEIALLMQQLEVDEETGEILTSSEDILQQLNALDMERSRILEYLAKVVLDTRAEAAALKAEEERLAKRRRVCEHREERLIEVLDRECNGQKTDLGIATLRYRATSRVEVSDAAKAISWLRRHKYRDCIRVKEPEVDKTAVRRLLTGGNTIPGIALVTGQSCSLK